VTYPFVASWRATHLGGDEMIARTVFGFLVLSFVFLPLERWMPVRRGQRVLRPGVRTDVVHFALSGPLGAVGLLAAAAPFALVVGAFAPVRGAVASQPAVFEFVEALVIVDLLGYAAHRLTHSVPALWKLHRVHHSSPQLDWLAAAHLHPLDTVVTRSIAVVPLFMIGFSRSSFGAAVVLLQAHAIFQHANVRVRMGPLNRVVSSPQFHHWHHTHDPGARDHNFAGLFPWIDALFGTLHLPKDTWPESYGIDDELPAGYVGQLASPFRDRTSRQPGPVPTAA
jgi:sterol desaturase/sphingolipid hydroxylase (fatty acid hydroxylase superfamily)